MSSTQQKIQEVEAEIARTQKNKATEGHLGLLKAKLAKLKREFIETATKASGGGGEGFEVGKSGDARIGLVGFPSVGKSTLLTKLTGAFSKCAEWEFTTLTCIPGTILYKGAKIQLLDMPGIIEGAKENRGKGRQVIAVSRTCNLIIVVLDATRPAMHKKIIEGELEGFGIRLNKRPPNIVVRRRDRGGVEVSETVRQTKMSRETALAILKEYKQNSVDVVFHCDADEEDLIDVLESNRRYLPCLYVLNKIDAISLEELRILDTIPHYVPISGLHGWNIDELYETIWDYLRFIRVYTKPRGQIPDYAQPVILQRGASAVEQFCHKIHRDMLAEMKYAFVWGGSVKHNPQKVGREHVLLDEDIVQIIKKN